MKLLTYAIASIVAANTGHGLQATRYFVDPPASPQRAQGIRSKSVHGLAASIKAALGEKILRLKARAQERRDLKQLMAMNDRLLKDIGLTRGDLVAVELGKTTLAELYAERRSARGSHGATLPGAAAATAALPLAGEAANQEHYHAQKCA